MQNLEQIRAKNALHAAAEGPFNGKNGGQIVKKVPTMILENGILPTIAFALEKTDSGNYKNEDTKKVFDHIITHLGDPQIKVLNSIVSLELFLKSMVNGEEATSLKLRKITTETMAYLSYFRRFAGKSE